MPEVGDKAPDFTLRDQHGNSVSLADLRGKDVVLYFYPKADTWSIKRSRYPGLRFSPIEKQSPIPRGCWFPI